jgi:hypothetical protein
MLICHHTGFSFEGRSHTDGGASACKNGLECRWAVRGGSDVVAVDAASHLSARTRSEEDDAAHDEPCSDSGTELYSAPQTCPRPDAGMALAALL